MILTCCFAKVQIHKQMKTCKNHISLRGQVEDLQSELKILKAEHQNSMSYLNTRKTEIGANIDRKNFRFNNQKLKSLICREN